MSLLSYTPKVTGSKLTDHSHYLQNDEAYYGVALRIESGKGHIINSYDYDETLFHELQDIDNEGVEAWLNSKFKGVRNRPRFDSTALHYQKRGFVFVNYCYYGMNIGVKNVGKYHGKLFEIFSNLDMNEVRDWFKMKVEGINKSKSMPKRIKDCGDD